jgi:hypothetical protein
MTLTVPKAFSAFAASITPTDSEEATIAGRRTAVVNFMLAKYGEGSTMPLIETKVIGSAGRKTLIRPVEDVDIFCVFSASKVWPNYKNNSQELLYRVREALTGYSVKTVGARGQAVRLFYSQGPNVDITPASASSDWWGRPDGYVIPRGDGGWQKTNPYEHGRFMAKRNEQLSYHLKPLVRLLKRWNQQHSRRLRSFHLELIVQQTFGQLGSDMRQATLKFFEWGVNNLHVNDPAGYSGDLAVGLTSAQQQAITQSFDTAAEHARRAQAADAAGKTAEAFRQWRLIFGDGFPSYG